jgi:8-oxo-dGTP diphosphatase
MNRHPSRQDIKLATDAAIFTVRDGRLCLLLIQMKKKPFTGRWALPGGLLEDGETSESAARRILSTQTGVADGYLEQLMTFDDPKRDPLGRVVSVGYFALLPSEGLRLRTTEKYADVRWWPVTGLPKLAYDHAAIARTALERLRAKLEYTNIVSRLLPASFPLSQLQGVYEDILGRPLDKRNFRKKILSLGLLAATGKMTVGGAHRPAELFRFKRKDLTIIEII